jgi:hypothetical protein
MRQIVLGAWLLLTSWVVAACSGEKFSSNDEGSGAASGASSGGSGSGKNGGSAGRASGGAKNGGSAGLGGGSATAGHAGTAPAGGASGVAGGDSGSGGAGNCAVGSVTFLMVPGPELSKDYLCDAGCGTGWLTITDAAGAGAFPIFSACGTASCDSCQVLPCPAAACLPAPLTEKGSSVTWNGTYLAQDLCGAKLACQRQACVAPGKYKAKACAAISAGSSGNGPGCAPQDALLCAEAEFDFPAASEVKLVLKQP